MIWNENKKHLKKSLLPIWTHNVTTAESIHYIRIEPLSYRIYMIELAIKYNNTTVRWIYNRIVSKNSTKIHQVVVLNAQMDSKRNFVLIAQFFQLWTLFEYTYVYIKRHFNRSCGMHSLTHTHRNSKRWMFSRKKVNQCDRI